MGDGMAGSATRLTYDDFALFPDDGKRHELIDGEHFVTPSPNVRHQRIAMTLSGFIWLTTPLLPGLEIPLAEVFAEP